eukprot:CAMPEP_0115836834 /NCGR_PEP_ID=MMETSP0287-20121206/4912_1 /TAXON_ID=412157 /ORGANISM="Chrysochromulina rotalis, Strain UIO044" /LENGTH=72 /DNA_ID=CAMNT_0003290331 /DNA_START=552 /DNA_END=770 /DNA_ORIENTATION=-
MAAAAHSELIAREDDKLVLELQTQVTLGSGGQWLANNLEEGTADARDDRERDDEALILKRHKKQTVDQEPGS